MLDEGLGVPAQIKGGKVLDACAGCFRQKLSCQTSGAGGQKKIAKEPEESGTDDRESAGSGRKWMKTFIEMKVGPPKGVKTAMGQAYPGAAGMIEKTASPKRPIRTVGVEVKKRLEQYCELPDLWAISG